MAARTAARRPAPRRAPARPARKRGRSPARKRSRSTARHRTAIFAPAAVAGPLGWSELGAPLGHQGLAAMTALGLLLVPVAMLALLTAPGQLARCAIPRPVRRWQHRGRPHPKPGAQLVRLIRAADRNRCVGCGVRQDGLRAVHLLGFPGEGRARKTLQIDHFFPYALGGLLTIWNTFLLCPRCNVIKSDYWKDRGTGRVTYHQVWSADHVELAAEIVRRERLARFSLLRWWRIAWAL